MLAAIIESLSINGRFYLTYIGLIRSSWPSSFPGGDSGTQVSSILLPQILSIQPVDGERENGIMHGRLQVALITFTSLLKAKTHSHGHTNTREVREGDLAVYPRGKE